MKKKEALPKKEAVYKPEPVAYKSKKAAPENPMKKMVLHDFEIGIQETEKVIGEHKAINSVPITNNQQPQIGAVENDSNDEDIVPMKAAPEPATKYQIAQENMERYNAKSKMQKKAAPANNQFSKEYQPKLKLVPNENASKASPSSQLGQKAPPQPAQQQKQQQQQQSKPAPPQPPTMARSNPTQSLTAQSNLVELTRGASETGGNTTQLATGFLEIKRAISEENGFQIKDYKPTEEFQKLTEQIQQRAIKLIPFSAITNSQKLLGEGGFGSVYQGKWTTRDVAIKEMMVSYQEFRTMDQEMTFMAKERHPTLVSMYGVAVQEVRPNKLHCCIIMELMKTDLDTLIFENPRGKWPLDTKIRILRDVAEGVAFLHSQDVVHRDLKPKNVLLDDRQTAKITDLGIARVLQNKEQTQGCTIAFTARYASREAAVEEVTSFASDIWSFGLLAYEVITETRVWPDKSSNKIIVALAQKMDPFGGNLESLVQQEYLRALITQCCDYDPEKRLKANQVFDILARNVSQN